mgnify:CR=1 FL=1
MSLEHTANAANQGDFWATYGAPASVDWCEANYLYIHWIAELWNVLSSAPMLAIGLLAMWRLRRSSWRAEGRFLLCFLGLASVGLGSMAFHATLLKSAQALDELPMVYCSLVMTYCVVIRTKDQHAESAFIKRWRRFFTIYAIAFTWAYFTSDDYFVIFLTSFAAVVTYLVIQGWRIVFRGRRSKTLRRLYLVAAFSFIAGVGLFWLPERQLGCEHALQSLHLHAWWHLLAMTGTYVGFLLVIYDRLLTIERDPEVRKGIVPWVAPKADSPLA